MKLHWHGHSYEVSRVNDILDDCPEISRFSWTLLGLWKVWSGWEWWLTLHKKGWASVEAVLPCLFTPQQPLTTKFFLLFCMTAMSSRSNAQSPRNVQSRSYQTASTWLPNGLYKSWERGPLT
jgi:hypothetical protein